MRVRVPRVHFMIVPVVIAALAAFGGVATAGKGGGGAGGAGGGKSPACDAPLKAKGKIDKEYVKDTAKCLDILEAELGDQALILKAAGSSCSTADPSFNDQFGDSLIKQATSGLDQDKKISKARVTYLKKASEESANKKQSTEIETAAQDVGKALFDADGIWSGMSGVGSALRNNDCDEAASKAGDALKASKDFKASVKKAKASLGKIK